MTVIRSNGAMTRDPSISAQIANRTKTDNDTAQIKQLAEEFESLFLGIVLKSMRDTVPKDGLINGGNAEDIYRSMLDTEYSKQMAQQRSTGLADNIEEYLLRAYKISDNPPDSIPIEAKSTAISLYDRVTRLK